MVFLWLERFKINKREKLQILFFFFRVLEIIRINYVFLCESDDMNFNGIQEKEISLFFKRNSFSLGVLQLNNVFMRYEKEIIKLFIL